MARADSVVLPALFYWRLERAFTQERLAERIAMTRITVWRIESGGPTFMRTARLLASALDVQVADLMGSRHAELTVHRSSTRLISNPRRNDAQRSTTSNG